jgi:hypothetical protein
MSEGLTQKQLSWIKSASRQEEGGWHLVRIGGEPYARGFQHGYLLADELAQT